MSEQIQRSRDERRRIRKATSVQCRMGWHEQCTRKKGAVLNTKLSPGCRCNCHTITTGVLA